MSNEIKSNEKDLEKIWTPCKLNRRKDAEAIIQFLRNLHENKKDNSSEASPNNYVINIDASWGYGKTFFLGKLQQHLEHENYMVASINAWESDYTDEPLLIAMGAIQDTLIEGDAHFKEKAKQAFTAARNNAGKIIAAGAKGAAKQVAKKLIGEEGGSEIADSMIDSTADAIGSALEKELTKVTLRTDAIQNFRENIEDLLIQKSEDGKELPLYVIVDELDRCRPDYAISFLEAVKHIFSISNVYFIIATDTDQLQHSVRAVYGAEFDAKEYLKRFFDRTLHLSEIPHDRFIDYLLGKKFVQSAAWEDSTPRSKYVERFSEITQVANLQLRSIEQVIEIFEFSIASITEEECTPILLFLMIVLHQQGLPCDLKDYKENKNLYSKLSSLRVDFSEAEVTLDMLASQYPNYSEMSLGEKHKKAQNLLTTPKNHSLSRIIYLSRFVKIYIPIIRQASYVVHK